MPTRRRGQITALGLILFAVGLLLSIGWPDAWPSDIAGPLWRSTLQASLSASLSCLLGIILGLSALHAHPRWRPAPWMAILNTIPVMPTLVVILMVIAAYGRNGALSQAGFDVGASLYGLGGVVFAHAFINGPWVMQQLLLQWQGISRAHFQLADQLGLNGLSRWRILYWPYIRSTLWRQWGLVFLLCFTSFAVVLVLSGSPKWATLEVRLFQLITLEFDIAGAVSLAWFQCLLLLPLMWWLNRMGTSVLSFGVASAARPSRLASSSWVLGSLIWLIPMLALAWRASQTPVAALLADPQVHQAALTSLFLGTASALTSVVLGWWLARAGIGRLAGISAFLYFIVPSQVMALALFLGFRALGWGHPGLAVWVSNSLMCLPFVLSLLGPGLARYPKDQLMSQLDMNTLSRWRWVHWPLHRASLTWCFVFAFGLSLGDFGVVALFGSRDFSTLPYLLYQKLGSYRTQDAYGLAVLMWVALAALFYFARPRRLHA